MLDLKLGLVAATFGVIFVAELPDKSLFASLVLGTRYRARWVWLGVTAAFGVHVVLAVAAGGVLDLLPYRLVDTVVAVLFAVGAVLLLRPAGQDDEHAVEPDAATGTVRRQPRPLKVMATCFAVVFVGEWGDITQIAIANLTAKYHDPLNVGLGSLLGLSAVAGVAIKGGSSLLKRVDVTLVRRSGGVILAGLAVLTVAQLLL